LAAADGEDRPEKADVMAVFEDEWSYPEAKIFGDIFYERSEWVVRRFLPFDRAVLIQAMADWFDQPDDHKAMLAVHLASRFRLVELLPLIRELDRRILAGEARRPYEAEWTARAIADLTLQEPTADA
jgi:hypothetical protein